MESEYFFEQFIEQGDYSTELLPKGEYERCTFKDCTFENADLGEIMFLESEFLDCDLSNADIAMTSFQDVSFVNCKMLGLRFDVCNDFGFAASFDNCQLHHSSFYRMKFSSISFDNSGLRGVDFTEAEVPRATIRNCDLLNAVFERTNLEGADLRDSTGYSIDPEVNLIKGAKFTMPDAIGLLDKYEVIVEV